MFGNLLRRLKAITVESGQLKLKIFGGAFHLNFELPEHPIGVSVQEVHQLFEDGAVFLSVLCTDTRSSAHLDVVV